MKTESNKEAYYCECGQKLKYGWKYCPKCQKEIEIEISEPEKKEKSKMPNPTRQDFYHLALIIFEIVFFFFTCDGKSRNYLVFLIVLLFSTIPYYLYHRNKLSFGVMLFTFTFALPVLVVWAFFAACSEACVGIY